MCVANNNRLYSDPIIEKGDYAKARTVRNQFTQAIRRLNINCRCGGKARPIERMFRCYYCGEFFCFKCAGEHFGKTREEYYRNKEIYEQRK